MYKKISIKLGEKRNIDAENVDMFIPLNFQWNNKNSLVANQTTKLSQEELYQQEKEVSNNYRFKGTVNFLSTLVNKKINITTVRDIFDSTPVIELQRNFTNMSDVYLCTFNDTITDTSGNTINTYQILTNKNDFNIYKAGFAKNIFFEQIYNFNFNFNLNNFTGNTIYYFFNSDKTIEYSKNTIIEGEYIDPVTGERLLYSQLNLDESLFDPLLYDDVGLVDPSLGRIEFDVTDNENNNYKVIYNYEKFLEIDLKTLNENTNEFERLDFLFTNNYHYVYNNFVFKLLPEVNYIPTKTLYNDFILDTTQLSSTTNEELEDKC